MSELYRVRKSWDNADSQLGAFRVLANAIAQADLNPDYSVYDSSGGLIYKALFRVRKSWKDADSQLGAYTDYANATAQADANDGYRVYDYLGIPRYPVPYMVQITDSFSYWVDANCTIAAKTAKAGAYTIVDVKSPLGKLKSGAGWIDLTGLDVREPEKSPLELAAANVAEVYESCIGCTHKSGAYTWATAMKNQQVNCSIPASRVATLAGILPDGKRISHTSAVGSGILTKKNTMAKAISGYANLDTDKCSIVWIGKKYADMDKAYKKAGIIYIQDSNIAVCAGDGDIYACHEWAKQMSGGKYTKVKLSSGYTKNSYILFAIVPNNTTA